jgi:hypothetical protein
MQTAAGREDPPGGHLCCPQKGVGEPVRRVCRKGVLVNIYCTWFGHKRIEIATGHVFFCPTHFKWWLVGTVMCTEPDSDNIWGSFSNDRLLPYPLPSARGER